MKETEQDIGTGNGIAIAGMCIGLGLMLNGCFSGLASPYPIDVGSLGREIGKGIAHAACIEAGGDWSGLSCRE